jgi:hypothetical protein
MVIANPPLYSRQETEVARNVCASHFCNHLSSWLHIDTSHRWWFHGLRRWNTRWAIFGKRINALRWHLRNDRTVKEQCELYLFWDLMSSGEAEREAETIATKSGGGKIRILNSEKPCFRQLLSLRAVSWKKTREKESISKLVVVKLLNEMRGDQPCFK